MRRPLSGGKGTIRQHKPTKKNPQGESSESFYKRLKEVIESDKEHFFFRLRINTTEQNLRHFRNLFLSPTLKRLCNWYNWITEGDKSEINQLHYQYPYGIYNPISEGGSTFLDNYISTGSKIGLEVAETVFPELQEDL